MRRSRRLLYAVIATVLVLIALSPAGHAADRARRAGDRTTIRDVESSLGGLSAGIAKRVPIPTIGPAVGTAASGFAATASFSWIARLLTTGIALGCVGLTRRDRAPPRLFHLLPA